MSSATTISPPTETARLVVDTDVASFVFKWHPEFAPRYVAMLRGFELVLSFMTLGEMWQGAMDANWGRRKLDVLESVPRRLFRAAFRQRIVLDVGGRSQRELAQGAGHQLG